MWADAPETVQTEVGDLTKELYKQSNKMVEKRVPEQRPCTDIWLSVDFPSQGEINTEETSKCTIIRVICTRFGSGCASIHVHKQVLRLTTVSWLLVGHGGLQVHFVLASSESLYQLLQR